MMRRLCLTLLFGLAFLLCVSADGFAASKENGADKLSKPEKLMKEAAVKEVEIELGSPMYVIQKYTKELRNMMGVEKRKGKVKADREVEAKLASKVREFFDFQRLARLSLGPHWGKITKSQRNEYASLFIQLVEDSYIRRSRDLVGQYKISFGREKIEGQQASITCTVARDDADIDIVYELHKNSKNWMIYNIVLDNVDLIRNYQSQFNRIIGKSGFKELIRLLRKKVKAQDEPEVVL